MKSLWYENTERFIPACWQPSRLLELAQQREIDKHKLLQGTPLFLKDADGLKNKKISPAEFSKLLVNARGLSHGNSFSFLYGDSLLPGFSPKMINALSHACNLSQTLEALDSFPLLNFPLLKFEKVNNTRESGLELVNVFNLTDGYVTAVEAALACVCSWVKWQSKMNLPWRFELNFDKPTYVEEYELHLGENMASDRFLFNSVRCRMVVDNKHLFTMWPEGSSSAFESALQYLSEQQEWSIQQGFCGQVRYVIKQKLDSDLGLEQVAAAFCISASSLKRKLKQHATSFQRLLDQCRAEKAVELMEQGQLSTEQISELLRIPDASNFRRSFKKWTGFTPKSYRTTFNFA